MPTTEKIKKDEKVKQKTLKKPTKLKEPLKENEFYCVGCRKRVKIPVANMCVKMNHTSKRTVPTLIGKCEKCKCKLNKFIKNDSVSEMTKKYGACM